MDTTAERVLSACDEILAEYASQITQGAELKSQLLRNAFELGRRSVAAVRILLKSDGANSRFASAVARSFFEVAVRVLWASRESNGWDRLFEYYISENLKWAECAKSLEGWADVAKWVKDSCTPYVACGRSRATSPQYIETVLRTIENQDIKANFPGATTHDAASQYNILYRMSCRSVHPHLVPSHMDKDRVFLDLAWIVTMSATYALIQGWCHAFSGNGATAEILGVKKRLEAVLPRKAQ